MDPLGAHAAQMSAGPGSGQPSPAPPPPYAQPAAGQVASPHRSSLSAPGPTADAAAGAPPAGAGAVATFDDPLPTLHIRVTRNPHPCAPFALRTGAAAGAATAGIGAFNLLPGGHLLSVGQSVTHAFFDGFAGLPRPAPAGAPSPGQLAAATAGAVQKACRSACTDLEPYIVSQPRIYVDHQFQAYISLSLSDTGRPGSAAGRWFLREAAVQVTLLHSQGRNTDLRPQPLLNTSLPLAPVADYPRPGQSLSVSVALQVPQEFAISHPITSHGDYSLTCTVRANYVALSPAGAVIASRNVTHNADAYRFTATRPIRISQVIVPKRNNTTSLIDVAIQNTSRRMISIDSASFEVPSQLRDVIECVAYGPATGSTGATSAGQPSPNSFDALMRMAADTLGDGARRRQGFSIQPNDSANVVFEVRPVGMEQHQRQVPPAQEQGDVSSSRAVGPIEWSTELETRASYNVKDLGLLSLSWSGPNGIDAIQVTLSGFNKTLLNLPPVEVTLLPDPHWPTGRPMQRDVPQLRLLRVRNTTPLPGGPLAGASHVLVSLRFLIRNMSDALVVGAVSDAARISLAGALWTPDSGPPRAEQFHTVKLNGAGWTPVNVGIIPPGASRACPVMVTGLRPGFVNLSGISVLCTPVERAPGDQVVWRPVPGQTSRASSPENIGSIFVSS
ncbi:hypothetical protein H696_03469 [Fonticula alba]|uniref:Uncharacterized protein n=1 Tax=Fonticula alba TaxID=691883 RepID=A0A058Z6V6_FONAL|nr:hypothetical protein H696_03469 [Fonticula alba]KCV70004.1 hypothetical protein H696_03469 [Fonticula alba]|eukprot:XP_009495610.1 hypothetical protein H696_03469 [Fonticula alba]